MNEARDRKIQKLEEQVATLREEIKQAVEALAAVHAIIERGQTVIKKSPRADLLLANLHAFLKRHEPAPSALKRHEAVPPSLKRHEAAPPSRAQLWCVHVEGPDVVVPAPDLATATRWAERINQAASQYHAHDPSPYRPAIQARPVLWPYSAEDHAQGPSDEFRWLLEIKPRG